MKFTDYAYPPEGVVLPVEPVQWGVSYPEGRSVWVSVDADLRAGGDVVYTVLWGDVAVAGFVNDQDAALEWGSDRFEGVSYWVAAERAAMGAEAYAAVVNVGGGDWLVGFNRLGVSK